MIRIRFEEREKIGLQYILQSLHGCSPFGSERIRRLRFYAPEERAELETELYNVDRAAKAAGELKETYDKVMIALCQIKDIRGSLRRCRELETPDHVELFEIKGYLQRLETIIPLFEQIRAVTDFRGLAFHDPSPALAILDPDNTRSRGFYIPDSATPRLREIRQAKKQLEEQLFHAQTDAEKENLRMQRTRLCAEEDSEETKVRRAMGAALAPLADGLLEDAETLGRLDFIIQKALFAVRYGGILPEITDGELELTDMVNPELCDLLSEQGRSFVPVSIALDRGATVITGANMGGKTISLKLAGQIPILAQYGFFVPAKHAKIGLSNYMQILIGDSQSVERGLSSFGSEMEELKEILDKGQERSLILIDEIASGTNPTEGTALTKSLVDYLIEKPYISLITTHFESVTEREDIVNMQVRGLADCNFTLLNREIQHANRRDRINIISKYMDYRLYRVDSEAQVPKEALSIAAMLGINKEIIEGAKKYMK